MHRAAAARQAGLVSGSLAQIPAPVGQSRGLEAVDAHRLPLGPGRPGPTRSTREPAGTTREL
jgi:hypothetical protein